MSIREQSALSRLPTNGVKAIKEFLFKSLLSGPILFSTSLCHTLMRALQSLLLAILLHCFISYWVCPAPSLLLVPSEVVQHLLDHCTAWDPASSHPTLPAGCRAGFFSSQRPAGVPAEPPACPAPPLPSPRPGALCQWGASLVQISESLRSNYRQPSLVDTQHIWAWGRDRRIP